MMLNEPELIVVLINTENVDQVCVFDVPDVSYPECVSPHEDTSNNEAIVTGLPCRKVPLLSQGFDKGTGWVFWVDLQSYYLS
jgi:hypothetical protein